MATDLGISPHAVEKRLKMARAKLGVSSSLAAARILAASEGDQLLVPHISDLPDGTNQSQNSDVAVPAAWAASLPKGLTMIAAICLIALIGQDVPPAPAASPPSPHAPEVVGKNQKSTNPQFPDEDYWRERVRREAIMMANDIPAALNRMRSTSQGFKGFVLEQAYQRSLSEILIFKLTSKNDVEPIAELNPYNRDIERDISAADVAAIRSAEESISVASGNHVGTIVQLSGENMYLYATRVSN